MLSPDYKTEWLYCFRLGSVVEQFLREIHPDYYNFSEEVSMLMEIITDYVSLVLVFDMEEDSDLDGYMISSLLASGKNYFL